STSAKKRLALTAHSPRLTAESPNQSAPLVPSMRPDGSAAVPALWSLPGPMGDDARPHICPTCRKPVHCRSIRFRRDDWYHVLCVPLETPGTLAPSPSDLCARLDRDPGPGTSTKAAKAGLT